MKTTKQNIRQAALSLFADRGYEATSVRDIAEALSLSKGALYRHYADKRAILDAILESADITASLPPPLDPSELTRFGTAAFRRLTAGETAELFRLLTTGQYGDPTLRCAHEKLLYQLPLAQISGALSHLPEPRRGQEALLFWSPLLALASRFDAAADQTALYMQASEHCRALAARYKKQEKDRQKKLLIAAAYARLHNPFRREKY